MKRIQISALAIVVALIPAVLGLRGNVSFSQDLPVRVPVQAQITPRTPVAASTDAPRTSPTGSEEHRDRRYGSDRPEEPTGVGPTPETTSDGDLQRGRHVRHDSGETAGDDRASEDRASEDRGGHRDSDDHGGDDHSGPGRSGSDDAQHIHGGDDRGGDDRGSDDRTDHQGGPDGPASGSDASGGDHGGDDGGADGVERDDTGDGEDGGAGGHESDD